MTNALRPYPSYKDSGVSWLGKIPTHWECKANRAIFEEVIDRGHADEPMLSVTIAQGVISQLELLAISSTKDSSNLDRSSYKLVQPGDIVYNKMRAWQGAIGCSAFRGIVSPAYIVARPRAEQEPRYFHFLYRTPMFAKEAERWSYGIVSDQWSLRYSDFRRIYSPVPPIEEQKLIVRFIAHVNALVNRFLRAKRRLIELLNEQKQAITHQAVTRGLDSDAPLKPSGVDWLGDIPAHWEVRKIATLAKVGNGSTPSRSNAAYWTGGDYPWLNSSCVNQKKVVSAEQFVTNLALRECHLPRVQPGSVLVAITGQGKTRGTATVLGVEATINQHMAFITPRNGAVSAEYLQMFLTAAYPQLRAISDDSGSTKGALTCEDVKRFKVALPPMHEQEHIVGYLRQELVEIDSTADRITREIELIREYRTRLIADVVTGKLDVREAATGLPQTGDEETDALLEGDTLLGDDGDVPDEDMDGGEEVTADAAD